MAGLCLTRVCAVTAGVSAHAHKNWGSDYEGQAIFARALALCFMVLSIGMVLYAAYNFRKRGDMLQCAPSPQFALHCLFRRVS